MDSITTRRIGIAALELRLGVDRSTIWRWYSAGRFPAPHYLGSKRTWFIAEIEAWELRQMSRPAEARQAARHLNSRLEPTP